MPRFQHTAARRRLVIATNSYAGAMAVSTHSRPKAAGSAPYSAVPCQTCFNTQPPEGGWEIVARFTTPKLMFQHTAARRRLEKLPHYKYYRTSFNTQPPEGGWRRSACRHPRPISFNTQPPEGGWARSNGQSCSYTAVSTHSRPKAAGPLAIKPVQINLVSTHSRPKAAGVVAEGEGVIGVVSTHSRPKAAGQDLLRDEYDLTVSTHSRPKAAGTHPKNEHIMQHRFNTQPPEGGWPSK